MKNFLIKKALKMKGLSDEQAQKFCHVFEKYSDKKEFSNEDLESIFQEFNLSKEDSKKALEMMQKMMQK